MFKNRIVLAALVLPGIIGAGQVMSPAEQKISAITKQIKANPASPQLYNELAAALCRRVRETGDRQFFDKAEEALQHATELSPGNYDAEKLQIAILIGNREFDRALARAKDLNRRVPDDVAVWGLLVDANIELGNYAEAEKAAQWMLDLRRGNRSGFIQAARLREVFGDLEGSIEFMHEALRRTPEAELEERAWLMTQAGRLTLLSGDLKRAGALTAEALKLYPDYYLAQTVLARIKLAEGEDKEAVSLFESSYRGNPTTDHLYDLAEALERTGKAAEAQAAFQKFEVGARSEMSKAFNSNLQLVFFYSDHRPSAREALTIAEQERRMRHDVRTIDAYAWALFKNGKVIEAKPQIATALEVGIRDPTIFCHASQIAQASGDQGRAEAFQRDSNRMIPGSCQPVPNLRTNP